MDIRLQDREMHLEKQCQIIFKGKKVVIILDCFKIFVEQPSNLQARAMTWSNYKHHNAIKVFLGITPQRVVLFVTESWGGHVIDKYLTEHCDILY